LRALALVELYGPPGAGVTASPAEESSCPSPSSSDDKWYDAATYSATPRPLALDEGTVYEALNTGDSAGFFTIAAARQEKRKGEWFAVGEWKSAAEGGARRKAAARGPPRETRTLTDESPPKTPQAEPGGLKAGRFQARASKKPSETSSGTTPARVSRKTIRWSSRKSRSRTGPRPPVRPPTPTVPRSAAEVGRKSAPCSTCRRRAPHPRGASPHSLRGQGLRNPAGPSLSASQVFIARLRSRWHRPHPQLRVPMEAEESARSKPKTIALAEAEVAKSSRSIAPDARGTPVAATDQAGGTLDKSKDGRREKRCAGSPPRKTSGHRYDLGLDNNVELVVTATSATSSSPSLRAPTSSSPRRGSSRRHRQGPLDAIPRLDSSAHRCRRQRESRAALRASFGDGTYRYALYASRRDNMARALAQRRLRRVALPRRQIPLQQRPRPEENARNSPGQEFAAGRHTHEGVPSRPCWCCSGALLVLCAE